MIILILARKPSLMKYLTLIFPLRLMVILLPLAHEEILYTYVTIYNFTEVQASRVIIVLCIYLK